jgi:hypothetical protein
MNAFLKKRIIAEFYLFSKQIHWGKEIEHGLVGDKGMIIGMLH